MSTCFGKLIIGITGLLVGSAGLADGVRKRKTLSVALGLLTALGSIVFLGVSLFQWMNCEGEEIDDDEDGETSAPEAETEPAPKPEEPAPKAEEESAAPAEEESASAQEDAE